MNLFERNAIEIFKDEKNVNIILFHGYGADANDLAPLHQMIRTKHKCNWFFPQGPMDVPLGGYGVGKAWWPISVDRYVNAGAELDISKEVPKGIEKLRLEFRKWLTIKNLESEKTLIAGFSQGGMLALDLFFSFPGSFHSLGLLSTNLINKDYLKSMSTDEIKSKQAFLSHGTSDSVLPVSGARALENFLIETGLKTKSTYFSGGHEIPPLVLNQFGLFLDNAFSAE